MRRPFLCSVSLFSFLIIITNFSFAQRPDKVYSSVKQVKTFEWYKSEAEQWGKILDKDKYDKEAWLNYFNANRMAKNFTDQKLEKEKGEYPKSLIDIVSEMSKYIPNTFEYYFAKVKNNHAFDDQQTKDMFKAYELGPDRTELYGELIVYYELLRDNENTTKFCKKMFDNMDMSPGILNWNYNVLASLDSNSVIITNGDNDTYPAWILQQVQNFRKDVIVMNINLLMIDRYRDKLFTEYKVKPFVNDSTFKSYLELMQGLIKHIAINSGGRNVYFALTTNPLFYEKLNAKTYMTGLAFKYSEKDFDNIACLINNYENKWLLDYLKADFINDISVSVVNQINTNYLPVFSKLYEHYKLSGKEESADKIKDLAKKLAVKCDNIENYKYLFEK